PLIASLMRRDRRVIGNYLRKPDNIFAWMQAGSISVNFIEALQAAGAIRQDIDPPVAAHLLEALSYGQLTIGDFKRTDQLPPVPVVLEALADLMERWLSPEDGGNSEAGKDVIRQIVATTRERLLQEWQTRVRRGRERWHATLGNETST